MSDREIRQLLRNNGFLSGVYPHGNIYWDLIVDNNDDLKNKICSMFELNIDTKPQKVALQCKEDFSECKLYCGRDIYNIDTKYFIECVKKLNQTKENYT